MNKIQASRLLTLAWFLRTSIPRKHFDMDFYWNTNDGEMPDLTKPQCGTTACALGWATVVYPDEFSLEDGFIVSFHGSHIVCDGIEVRDFFGLDYDEATDAFNGVQSRTPSEEARFLERLALKHGWVYA